MCCDPMYPKSSDPEPTSSNPQLPLPFILLCSTSNFHVLSSLVRSASKEKMIMTCSKDAIVISCYCRYLTDVWHLREHLVGHQLIAHTLNLINLLSTTIIALLLVNHIFLVDSLTSATLRIGARCCFYQLVATSVFMHNLNTHLEDNVEKWYPTGANESGWWD